MLQLVGSGTVVSPNPDPSTISSIWDWWEPSRESYANNDRVGSLTGQFAAKTFTASGGDRPTFKTNILNGLAVVDTLANFMSGPNATALSATHIFVVLKATNDPGVNVQDTPLQFGTDSPDLWPYVNGSVFMGAASNTRRSCTNPTLSLAAWRVCEIISTSSEYTVKLDGTETLFTSGTNTVAWCNPILICGNGASSWFTGQHAGWYMFSAKLNSTDRTTMVSYLNTRFGLSIS